MTDGLSDICSDRPFVLFLSELSPHQDIHRVDSREPLREDASVSPGSGCK